MTDRSGEKVSRLSESIESIESYHEPEQQTLLQLSSMCQEAGGGDALTQCGSGSRDRNVLLTDSAFEGDAQETTAGQDVVIQRTSNVDELTGPFPVTYRTQEEPSQAKQTPQSAPPKRVVKNGKKVKRRAKSEEHFDVPAALKSLRRRPRSGFPQRQSIIARSGAYPHIWGSGEDQWTAAASGGGGGRDDDSRQVTSGGEPRARRNQSCSSTSTLDSCSRDSWVDESNEDSSPCSSPLELTGRQAHNKVDQHVPQSSGMQELAERPRTPSVDTAAEVDMCSRLQRSSISSGEEQRATPDSRNVQSRSRSQSSNALGQGQIRNRESMTLAMENPPEEQFSTVIGSRIRIDPSAQPEETVSPTPNIFVTSSLQNICQNMMLSPSRTSETLPAVFVFPDQQSHTEPRQRTASVAPAPSQSTGSAAASNSSVVTPPRRPNLSGRRGKGRGRPTVYSEIPAALQSLRRKPRSGFGQRTSFLNRMQVGPQEQTRDGASRAQLSQSEDNSQPNLESVVPNTSVMTINDNLPVSRTIQHQSQIENQDHRQPSVPRTILEAIANVTVSTRSRETETAALRSLRRHPRSGFQRRRPRVSSQFPEACSETTPSEASGDTSVPTASVDEAAEVSRRSETPTDPVEQVVVSRRPALPDPDRTSPPPAYDDLFFYPVGDDIADIAEAFRPDEFNPRLPSYDDVLRLSQESPPPYRETADDTEPDS